MKRFSSLIILALFATAAVVGRAGIPSMKSEPLDRAKLDTILEQTDGALVSYFDPELKSPVQVDDKEWLDKIRSYLRQLDGTPTSPHFCISNESGITLFSPEKRLLSIYWRDDEQIVLNADDWVVELKVKKDDHENFKALCALKKENREDKSRPISKVQIEVEKIQLPNKALVPTVMSVTPAADAPVAPATTAAHL
jgi:hypothetical protein